ncbi:DNA polymerase III subunit delta' [Corynebacterium aquatimens]|uniref:DNA polymerase III subunit delta' n=1 Tax=Corynebacterium aquatimens TaxID=1190508 RepID=UPI002541887C|nr:DNA polymerase III subunit delta' [Corynebacterium aquatimens]QYH20370.1 DNA polymerase III subunit delta' [Corynebacterium aquatimens]
MTNRSVSERLADTPKVRDTILAAAAAARGLEGTDPRALAHSWLFTGPPGSGRSNAALAFAAALVCTDPAEIGCGRCKGCRDALAGQHTDLVHVVPKELTIAAKFVRQEIVAKAARLPTIASHRIVIIENADRLTEEAADALLKTVEEPPEGTVIVLCAPSTDPEDISQTLKSRCRHLYIPSPSEEEVVRILMEEEGASESNARLAAATSLRHLGRARKLVHSEAIQARRANSINLAELVFFGSQAFQAVATLVKATEKEAVEDHAEADAAEREKLERAFGVGAKGKGAAKAASGAATALKELEAQQKARGTRRKRDVFDLVLVDLAGIYRDALVIQSGAGASGAGASGAGAGTGGEGGSASTVAGPSGPTVPLTHPDFEGLARELADRVDQAGLVACQDAITQCRERLHQQVAPLVAFNGMVGHLRRACKVD